MKNLIEISAEYVRDSDDFGSIYEITCPDCSCKVLLNTYESDNCNCRNWPLVRIRAEGITRRIYNGN